jgi:hypothetical protein
MENVKEYLLNNEDKLQEVVAELNSWNGSLDNLEFYSNDEYTINEIFATPYDFAEKCAYGDYNINDEYLRFDGYGNIETCTEQEMIQDMKDCIDDIIDVLENEYNNIDIDDKLLDLIESDLGIEKEETSLDDLIKGAVEKTKDQPVVESPTKDLDMER